MNRTLPERIFICGFMGAGKSTLGKALAKKLAMPFHDLDRYIEKRAGQTIPSIFEQEGEEGFRKKEKKALLQLIRTEHGVVALGGGTLHNQHLLDHVKVNGLLVWVDAPIEMILNRVADDSNRPLLLDEDGDVKSKSTLKKQLDTLYKKRTPFYEQSEITVDSSGDKTATGLADDLVKKIQYHVALH